MINRLISILFITFLPWSAQAQKPFEEFGDYQVYFSVFNSSFIQPEIAKAYGIIRAKDQVLINIAVIKQTPDGPTEGLAAVINGISRNLMQQEKPLKFTEIREQNAVYYLAALRISNEEVLHFDISATVADEKPFDFSFTRKLYVDP